MERAVVILCALLVNAVLGGFGPARFMQWPASVLRNAERKLNRDHRSLKEREMRGAVVVAAGLALSLLLGWLGGLVFTSNLRFVEMLLIALLLPVRSTWDIANRIHTSLKSGDLAAARAALDGTPWRHHALMDDYGVCRAGIEMLAVHFSEKILAPSLFYILLGLPGLLASRSIALMQESIAFPLPSDRGFGRAAAWAHYLMHYLTARLAMILWLAAMLFVPSADPRLALSRMAPSLAASPPARLSILASATALRLSLGGPASPYAGGAWLGDGNARPVPADLKRALYLYALLHLFLLLVFGAFL